MAMSEMDELLAELKAEYTPKKPQSPAKSKPKKYQPDSGNQSDRQIDNLLADLQAEFTSEKPKKLAKPVSPTKSASSRSNSTFDDNLLADLTEEYQAKEKEAQQQRQQELREQERREQQKKQRRRQALSKEAEEWLKTLDLNTDEGLWFEEFSYAYDSKLEAAIDYLQAIRETRRLS